MSIGSTFEHHQLETLKNHDQSSSIRFNPLQSASIRFNPLQSASIRFNPLQSWVIMLMIAALGWSSCQRNFDEAVNPGTRKASVTVNSQGGFLEFESVEAFVDELDERSNMSDEEYLAWATGMGLTTLRELEIHVSLEEQEIEESLPEEYDGPLGYTATFYANPKSLLAVEFIHQDSNDSIKYIESNLTYKTYANLLNADGVVKVDGVLYQFKKGVRKYILGGDAEDLVSFDNIGAPDVVEDGYPLIGAGDGTGDGPPPTPLTCNTATSGWTRNAVKISASRDMLGIGDIIFSSRTVTTFNIYELLSQTACKDRIAKTNRYKYAGGYHEISIISQGNVIQGDYVIFGNPSIINPFSINLTFNQPHQGPPVGGRWRNTYASHLYVPFSLPHTDNRPKEFRVSCFETQPLITALSASCRVDRWGGSQVDFEVLYQ